MGGVDHGENETSQEENIVQNKRSIKCNQIALCQNWKWNTYGENVVWDHGLGQILWFEEINSEIWYFKLSYLNSKYMHKVYFLQFYTFQMFIRKFSLLKMIMLGKEVWNFLLGITAAT